MKQLDFDSSRYNILMRKKQQGMLLRRSIDIINRQNSDSLRIDMQYMILHRMHDFTQSVLVGSNSCFHCCTKGSMLRKADLMAV